MTGRDDTDGAVQISTLQGRVSLWSSFPCAHPTMVDIHGHQYLLEIIRIRSSILTGFDTIVLDYLSIFFTMTFYFYQMKGDEAVHVLGVPCCISGMRVRDQPEGIGSHNLPCGP